MERRPALLPGGGRVLPPLPRGGDGHPGGPPGRGLVQGRRAPGARSRSPTTPSTRATTRCSCSRRRTTPARRRATFRRRPNYLQPLYDALAANGFTPDVYNVDAAERSRTAPHPLGVLSHYRDGAVVWYTGDDYLTREPAGAGYRHVAARARRDHRRARLPQRGRQARRWPASTRASSTSRASSSATTDSRSPTRASTASGATRCCRRAATAASRTRTTSSSTTWGRTCAWRTAARGTTRPAMCVRSSGRPVQRHLDAGRSGRRSGRRGAYGGARVDVVARCRPRDGLRRLLGGHRGVVAPEAGPFSPHSGTHYLYSGQSDVAYMRLHRGDRARDRPRDTDVLGVAGHRGRLGLLLRGGGPAARTTGTRCRTRACRTPVRTPASRAGTVTAGPPCTAA